MRRHARTLGLSAALAFGFAWVLNKGALPLLPPRGSLDGLRPLPLAGFVLGMLVHMLTRFARCQFLLAPIARVPLRRLMTINAIAMALIILLPLRLGELSRPAMLRERGRVSAWAVTGTVGAERILDGVAFSLLLILGLALAAPHSPLPDRVGDLPISAALVPKAALLASLGFGSATALLVAFYFWRHFARRVVGSVLGLLSRRLAEKVVGIIERFCDGLSFLAHPRHAIAYVAVTAVSITAHVYAVVLLAEAVGLGELTFSQAMVVVGVLALGFAVPNAPGFFGSVQLALYAGLAVYLNPERVVYQGAALVFLFYVTFIGLVLLLAVLALAVEHFSNAAVAPSLDTQLE